MATDVTAATSNGPRRSEWPSDQRQAPSHARGTTSTSSPPTAPPTSAPTGARRSPTSAAQADEAVDAGLPYDQLDARLHDLADQFKAAIVADLQTQAEHPHGGRDEERVRTDGDEPG